MQHNLFTIHKTPLDWPRHVPRTDRRERSRFRTTIAGAVQGIIEQCRLMQARDVVISSNGHRTKTGALASDYINATLADPGVAVYFRRADASGESCVACDRWNMLADNLQAVKKTIEALRGIEMWGSSDMVDQAFAGYAALPETAGGEGWWVTLGISPSSDRTEIETAYKILARKHHPDAPGGDRDRFERITAAYRIAKDTVAITL